MQYPAVLSNAEVTQTVSFLGIDLEEDTWGRWIADYFLTWQFFTGQQALSIPPKPEELWKAFHGKWERIEIRKNDGLFFPEDDEASEYPGLIGETFVFKFSESTRRG